MNNITIISQIKLKSNLKTYILVLCVGLFFGACNSVEQNSKTPELQKVDIPAADSIKVSVMRLDRDLFSLNPDSVKSATPGMVLKYGNFYKHYVKGFLNNGGLYDSSYAYSIKQFITNNDMKDVYNECQKQYSDVSFLENQLAETFTRYRYFFPNKHLPKVATLLTGFNYSILYSDSVLGISLEMYLGMKNKFYEYIPPDVLPGYKRLNMNKENILPDCIKGWLTLEFPANTDKSDFLSTIINNGKTLYLVDALLPNVPDTLKISYTGKQLDWCEKNEFNMWAFFIEKKVLFTTDYNEILRYTGDGPFTAAFNKESPSRVGTWIGWQIVRKYMQNNPTITLQQLIDEKDAQKILSKSKYKPIK
ncbi:MAG: hypothetical protein J0M08_07335 [Bacteroidetes bacterium]|nr:hypothetical protein [Bacteroidota bacterium]